MNEEEINAINIQLGALFFSVVSIIISIVLTYNQKLEAQGQDTIFNTKQTFKVALFNRLLILALSVVLLYVNYKLYQISEDEGEDLKSYQLQIWASILTIIASLIAAYVVTLSVKGEVSDIENPII